MLSRNPLNKFLKKSKKASSKNRTKEKFIVSDKSKIESTIFVALILVFSSQLTLNTQIHVLKFQLVTLSLAVTKIHSFRLICPRLAQKWRRSRSEAMWPERYICQRVPGRATATGLTNQWQKRMGCGDPAPSGSPEQSSMEAPARQREGTMLAVRTIAGPRAHLRWARLSHGYMRPCEAR